MTAAIASSPGGGRPTAFVVAHAPADRIERRLMRGAAQALAANGWMVNGMDLATRQRGEWRSGGRKQAGAVSRPEVVLVHSPFVLALPEIVRARLLRRTCVGLVWDAYPVTLAGRRYDRSVRRRLLDVLENIALRLVSYRIVPSRDFLAHPRFADARFVPFWQPSPREEDQVAPEADLAEPTPCDHPLRLLFAGQVNATRGLAEALGHLQRLTGGRFRLLVASPRPPSPDIAEDPHVELLGHRSHTELAAIARGCDAGLVSLSPAFDGPGFPSKTFDYAAWGLPVLFFGKRLPHMIDMVERSGLGLDINGRASLSSEEVRALRSGFGARREAFEAMTCIDSERFTEALRQIWAGRDE